MEKSNELTGERTNRLDLDILAEQLVGADDYPVSNLRTFS